MEGLGGIACGPPTGSLLKNLYYREPGRAPSVCVCGVCIIGLRRLQLLDSYSKAPLYLGLFKHNV